MELKPTVLGAICVSGAVILWIVGVRIITGKIKL